MKSAVTELGSLSARFFDSGVSQLLWVLDPANDQVSFWQTLTDPEAAESIVELLVKNHGGKIIDRVIDRIIERDEPPEAIH